MGKRRRCNEETDADPDALPVEQGEVARIGNQVFFYAEVTRSNVLKLLRLLDAAARVSRKKNCDATGQAYLFLHSEGGDAYAGLSAMDHIRARSDRMHVTCIADGFVASAATFLLLAGARRCALPHAVVLIHQVSTGFSGKYMELTDEMRNTEQLMDIVRDLYTTRTSLKRKQVDRIMKQELTMTAQQCIRWGVVEDLWHPAH